MSTNTCAPEQGAEQNGKTPMEQRIAAVATQCARNPNWVTDFGPTSNPHIGKQACLWFADQWGISLKGSVRRSETLVEPLDGSDKFYEFVSEAEFVDREGRVIPARGSCGTDERFVAGRRKDGSRFADWGAIRHKARSFADTRMYSDAVPELDLITWDDLINAGMNRDLCQKGFGSESPRGGGRGGRYNGPPSGNSAPPPQQQQRKQQPKQPEYDFQAAFAEIRRLGEMLGMDSDARKAFLVEMNGGPWQGKSPGPAVLDKAIADLDAQHGGQPPDEAPTDLPDNHPPF